MRNSIAASFVMYYLFLLSLLLIVPHIRGSVSQADAQAGDTKPFGEEIFIGFTTFLGIVLGFYFATQAAERITETVQSGKTTRLAIERQPEIAQQVINEQRIAARKGGPPF